MSIQKIGPSIDPEIWPLLSVNSKIHFEGKMAENGEEFCFSQTFRCYFQSMVQILYTESRQRKKEKSTINMHVYASLHVQNFCAWTVYLAS